MICTITDFGGRKGLVKASNLSCLSAFTNRETIESGLGRNHSVKLACICEEFAIIILGNERSGKGARGKDGELGTTRSGTKA